MTFDRLRSWTMTLIACSVAACSTTPQTLTLDLSLDHLSGNITAEQRAQVLQSPNARVDATYSPNVQIPGINAHMSRCGFLAMPCVTPDEETMAIHSAHVDTRDGRITFSVPLTSAKRSFPLQTMRIVLPFNELPDALPGEQGNGFDLSLTSTAEKNARRTMPIWLSSPYRALGGTLVLSDADGFAAQGGLPGELASNSWDPPYIFYPRNRFAGYADPSNTPFPVLQALHLPYPPGLTGMKEIYRADIQGGWVDGHWLERVDVSAKRKKDENCFVADLEYRILWVDGKLTHYSDKYSDPRDGQCTGGFRRLDFDDEGKVIAFDDSVVDMVDVGTHVTYRNWNSTCSTAPQQPGPSCTIDPPTADQISELLKSATLVRQWFRSSKVLQQTHPETPSS